ncbi:DUF1616 domain-containing protein [Methanomethylovorans sp.]|uniref:DUF1616 domain-containing protein n=1 Tax=Methanomethylovorans sp. TaxID=2758717 RepID=UPI00351C34A2
MVKNRVPGDLLVIASVTLLTNLFVFTPLFNSTEVRTLLGFLLVLFLPGYAMAAALFPGKYEISGTERVVFSVGLSVALVPFIGYGLLYTAWGMNIGTLMISISILILMMCIVALFRRSRLPEEEAFSVSIRSVYRLSLSSLPGNRSRMEVGLAALLLVSVLVSAATVGYVIINPKQGEGFTEFYILGPDGMSAGYPTTLTADDSSSVIVGVMNQEKKAVDYRLEILLDGSPLPLQTEEENIHLEDDERWERTVSFTPEISGSDMKLEFLLYRDADLSGPYRELYLWVDVQRNEAREN